MHHARHALLILLSALAIAWATPSTAQVVVVRITTPPPPLPVYVQPVIPGPDYFWAPGYWCWGPDGYYWVPGTWVLAPAPGLLWTPGYWAWRENIYVWHAGYWGPRVGFYGGVNYGFGYPGVGFHGGYWNGGVFAYNRAVTNIGTVNITNVYTKTVVHNTTVTNVSFNGGSGGTSAKPNAEELAAAKDKHEPATGLQSHHEHSASGNHALLASVNGGKPGVAATAAAGHFAGHGIVGSRGALKSGDAAKLGPRHPGEFKGAKMAGAPGPRPPPHAFKRPPHERGPGKHPNQP